jgi:hypothetical protein
MESSRNPSILLLTFLICLLVPRITFSIWTLCQPDSHRFLCMGNSTSSCGKLSHVGLFWGIVLDIVVVCGLIMGIIMLVAKITTVMPLSILVKLFMLYAYGYWLIAIPTIGLIGHDFQYYLYDIPQMLMIACAWQIGQVGACVVVNLISLCVIKHPEIDHN